MMKYSFITAHCFFYGFIIINQMNFMSFLALFKLDNSVYRYVILRMASSVNMHSIAKIAHASYKPPPSKEDLALKRVKEKNEKERASEDSNLLAMEALHSAGGDKLKVNSVKYVVHHIL